MQLREQIKDAEKDGTIYGERRVQIIPSSGETPIVLSTTGILNIGDTITGQITFELDKSTGKWKRNNPEAQERFLSLETGESFALIIPPHHELKPNLSEVGWITSAYLFAFYTFGYRYIFHPSLDIVREYILKSFDDLESASLEVPKLDNFGLTECKEHNLENPEIGIIIPTDRKTPIHIQVSFLDYHIRLPFHFVPHILQAMILSVPGVADKFPEILGTETYLYSPITCNKSDMHVCKWDYVLGKSIAN